MEIVRFIGEVINVIIKTIFKSIGYAILALMAVNIFILIIVLLIIS